MTIHDARPPEVDVRPADIEALGELLPDQGRWSEEDYLWLTRDTRRLVELVDGRIEVLPMPSDTHQTVLAELFARWSPVFSGMGGRLLFAPLRLRVGPSRFREPDLLGLLSVDDPRRGDAYWSGADVVVEIVSPDSRRRDLEDKRSDYAAAGVAEYWVVDPAARWIRVFRLEQGGYRPAESYGVREVARSGLAPGLDVAVDALLGSDDTRA